MKRMMKRALLFLVTLSMMMLLPAASLGESQPEVAKGVEIKTPVPASGASALALLVAQMDRMPLLPQGTKPVQKIIPRRCATVRQNDLVTISIVVAPATLRALEDLTISWDPSELEGRDIYCRAGKNSLTLYLTFIAIGKPTDTTRVSYRSLTRKSAQSRTYVTIVPMPVSRVVVSPSTMNLPAGEQTQLEAYVFPKFATNKSVRWSSSNKSVAIVSPAGIVTALKPGITNIYATSVNGKKKAKCVVTVLPPAPHY